MKYRKGRELNLTEALNDLLNGKPVFDAGGVFVNEIRKGKAWSLHASSGCESEGLALDAPYHEAIPEPEYDLTFMEAWEEMKKGKTVERDDQWKMEMPSDLARSKPWNADVTVSKGVIDSKYRVVDPA